MVAGNTLAFRAKYNKAIITIPTDVPRMIHDGWIAIVLCCDERLDESGTRIKFQARGCPKNNVFHVSKAR